VSSWFKNISDSIESVASSLLKSQEPKTSSSSNNDEDDDEEEVIINFKEDNFQDSLLPCVSSFSSSSSTSTTCISDSDVSLIISTDDEEIITSFYSTNSESALLQSFITAWNSSYSILVFDEFLLYEFLFNNAFNNHVLLTANDDHSFWSHMLYRVYKTPKIKYSFDFVTYLCVIVCLAFIFVYTNFVFIFVCMNDVSMYAQHLYTLFKFPLPLYCFIYFSCLHKYFAMHQFIVVMVPS